MTNLHWLPVTHTNAYFWWYNIENPCRRWCTCIFTGSQTASVNVWPCRLATVQLRRSDNHCSAPVTVCFDTVLLSGTAAHIQTPWDQDAVWLKGHMTYLLRHWLFIITVSLTTIVSFSLMNKCVIPLKGSTYMMQNHCSLNSTQLTWKQTILILFDCCVHSFMYLINYK